MGLAWLTEGEGPTWVPVLNAAEVKYDIPTNLLARVAFEESHFRRDIIDGTTQSSAGALGIMQLIPRFFPVVLQHNPALDIDTAGRELARLHQVFSDWQVALASYNWGQGDVQHLYARDADQYVLADMPPETQDYVRQITADVPVPGVLV